jgi:hypothetical protein
MSFTCIFFSSQPEVHKHQADPDRGGLLRAGREHAAGWGAAHQAAAARPHILSSAHRCHRHIHGYVQQGDIYRSEYVSEDSPSPHF